MPELSTRLLLTGKNRGQCARVPLRTRRNDLRDRGRELSRDQNVKVHSEKAVSCYVSQLCAPTDTRSALHVRFIPPLLPSLSLFIYLVSVPLTTRTKTSHASLFAFPSRPCISRDRSSFWPFSAVRDTMRFFWTLTRFLFRDNPQRNLRDVRSIVFYNIGNDWSNEQQVCD